MNRPKFWELIDSTRASADGDLDKHVRLLRERLKSFNPNEIVEFGRIFDEYWVRAYTWDLWGAAYIIGGGCSDDGFMDFRSWLISKGEKVYEDALRDVESLIFVVTEEDEDCQYEGFHYVASQAWEEQTGKRMDAYPRGAINHPAELLGHPWKEKGDDLKRRFPSLYRSFERPRTDRDL